MYAEPQMIPALQLATEDQAAQAVQRMHDAGIAAMVERIIDMPSCERPDWADPKSGEWILLIENRKFETAMNTLSQWMGYEEEEEDENDV